VADSFASVDCLSFNGGVPPGDIVGGCKLQAQASGFDEDQEQLASGIGREALDGGLVLRFRSAWRKFNNLKR